MIKYVFKSLLLIIPVLFCIVFIIFTINHLTPGDPVTLMLGADYTQEQYDNMAAQLGVDQPFFTQFYNYIKNIVTKFDFGTSYQTKRAIITDIAERFPNSLKLGLLSCAVTVILGIPFGVLCATHQNKPGDYAITFLSVFFAAAPGFWLSMMMILLFSLKLGWLPASGLASWKGYVMPVISGAIGAIAGTTRFTRSSMLEVIRQDYIRTARAKGLSEGAVIRKHALRNALIPVVTVIGMQLGMVVGGAAIVESIHSFPGMGTLLLSAINNKDYPMIQTIVLFLSFFVCLMNVAVDIAYGFLDPRIRAQYAGKSRRRKAAEAVEKAGGELAGERSLTK